MLSMKANPDSSEAGTPPPSNSTRNGFPPEEEEDLDAPPKAPSLWTGWDGLSVMTLGLFLPALLITISGVVCFERIMRMTFKHPVETLVECLFVALIPFANYLAWKAIRHQDSRHPFRLGLLNGAAIVTSFGAALIIFASIFFNYAPAYGLLGAVALMSGICGVYMAVKLRDSAMTRQTKANRIIFSAVGVLLAIAGLGACEARGTVIRVAENLALSDTGSDRNKALEMLRGLNCEQELRMQCADDRMAGIPGMFWRISPQRERELYFAVTGRPYGNSLTESVYSMSDEYLSRHVVGTPIKGLNLLRSAITGYVNAETLTSTVNWTFVFKNGTFEAQEARAELAMPPGAVISNMTLWAKGEPHQAYFGPTDRVQRTSRDNNWVDVSQSDPALITDLGRGRALMKCSPIPAQGELKLQVTITERLKPLTLTEASMSLPKFVDANFAMAGEHNLRIHSTNELSTAMPEIRQQPAADGGHLLVGTLKEADLNGGNLSIAVKRAADSGPYFIEDKLSSNGGYIKETVRQIATRAPEQLVVVIDNSESMNKHIASLVDALKRIPANVKTTVVLPTDGMQMDPLPLDKGIELIQKTKFSGGKDNLQAVIKAADAAGQSNHGAVLWIHGPQPSFNEEMYIMAPYIQRPSFYELALDDRWTDTNEFFKNHREIGPFAPVPRNSVIADDLRTFLSKWQPGGTEYVVELARSTDKPSGKQANAKQADELIRLCTRDECYKLLRENNLAEAAELATSCRIVTPVTGAIVLARHVREAAASNDPVQNAWFQGTLNATVSPSEYQQHEGGTAQLQGATNGTIGPQGTDATVITGINTAGTVRVNNLANLEAVLNIFANLGEMVGIAIGAVLLIPGVLGIGLENPVKLSPHKRAIIGGALMTLGFLLPGFINWMVASARDANLFS